MDKPASRPAFFSNLQTLDEKIGEKVTDDEKFIYGMSQQAGWEVFTKRKNELLQEMDQLQDVAISKGTSKEEIGENAIIINMVKGTINRLWKIVDDSREACGDTA
jgi:hypothetical protein